MVFGSSKELRCAFQRNRANHVRQRLRFRPCRSSDPLYSRSVSAQESYYFVAIKAWTGWPWVPPRTGGGFFHVFGSRQHFLRAIGQAVDLARLRRPAIM